MCKENGTSNSIDARQAYRAYLPVCEDVAAECRLTARDELELSKALNDTSRKQYLTALMTVQAEGRDVTTEMLATKGKPGVHIPINEFDDQETRNLKSGNFWRVFMGAARKTAAAQLELFKAGSPDAPGVPKAKKIGKTIVKLKWAPPTNDGGAVVDGYFIEKMLVEFSPSSDVPTAPKAPMSSEKWFSPPGTVEMVSNELKKRSSAAAAVDVNDESSKIGEWMTAVTHTWSDKPTWTVDGLSADRTYRFRVSTINRVNVSQPGSTSEDIPTKSDAPSPAADDSPSTASPRSFVDKDEDDDEDEDENEEEDQNQQGPEEEESGDRPAPRELETRKTSDLPFWIRFWLEQNISSHEHGDDAFLKSLEQLEQSEVFISRHGIVLLWLMCSGRVLYDIGEEPVASGRLDKSAPTVSPMFAKKEEQSNPLEWQPNGKREAIHEKEENDDKFGYPQMSQSDVPVASFTLLKFVIAKFWMCKCMWGSVEGPEDGAQTSLLAALSLVCDAAHEGPEKLAKVRDGMPPFPIVRNLANLTRHEGLRPDRGQVVTWAHAAYEWAVHVLDAYGGEAVESPVQTLPVLDRILAVVSDKTVTVTLRPADVLAARPTLPDCESRSAKFYGRSAEEADFNYFPLRSIANSFVTPAIATASSFWVSLSEKKASDVNEGFSFSEIAHHAKTTIAKRYVDRMSGDLESVAKKAQSRKTPTHLCSISRVGLGAVHTLLSQGYDVHADSSEALFAEASTQVADTVKQLEGLIHELQEASCNAERELNDHRRCALEATNKPTDTAAALHALSSQRPELPFTLVAAAMLCKDPPGELRRLNPALSESAIATVQYVLNCRCSRKHQNLSSNTKNIPPTCVGTKPSRRSSGRFASGSSRSASTSRAACETSSTSSRETFSTHSGRCCRSAPTSPIRS